MSNLKPKVFRPHFSSTTIIRSEKSFGKQAKLFLFPNDTCIRKIIKLQRIIPFSVQFATE